ncbi:hypothetical protein BASA81_005311 [Batrachochytrium salamandrivorans]|nr:hypothetical protein BASA81_005311 [Batrachochytrium salamandrivorans]
MARSDTALDEFDRLRLREVRAEEYHTVSTFLVEFQTIAASLEPNERIKLVVCTYESGLELLKTVLLDPQANKICSLQWLYGGEEDVNSVVPHLINNCPELASLRAEFGNHSAFDFVSSVLEHPSAKLRVLEVPEYYEGDLARFFTALGQSQVSAITIVDFYSPDFCQALSKYLARGLLVRLTVTMLSGQIPLEVMASLANCTCLVELTLRGCEFFHPTAFTHLPRSISNLALEGCTFVGPVDWSFLANGSNMQKIDFDNVRGVDGNQLGSALAVHLRAKGLDELFFYFCDFIGETLAAVGVEVGRIKRLSLGNSIVNDASVAQIALALLSPNNEMKELRIDNWDKVSIETYLVPALRHPNCNLARLELVSFQSEREAVAGRVTGPFHNRRALLVLLQGQQVRRLRCPLRRLPVDLLRLVGKMLI